MADLEEKLLALHGPLLSGPSLCQALGFCNQAALARAIRRGVVGVETFELPGRKGRFAHTAEVAQWIAKQNQKTIRPQVNRSRYAAKKKEVPMKE